MSRSHSNTTRPSRRTTLTPSPHCQSLVAARIFAHSPRHNDTDIKPISSRAAILRYGFPLSMFFLPYTCPALHGKQYRQYQARQSDTTRGCILAQFAAADDARPYSRTCCGRDSRCASSAGSLGDSRYARRRIVGGCSGRSDDCEGKRFRQGSRIITLNDVPALVRETCGKSHGISIHVIECGKHTPWEPFLRPQSSGN
jgi:hypothetical protein